MQINLATPARKILVTLACLLAAIVYVALAGLPLVAEHFAQRADLAGLQRAIRLQPGNANYRYRLGRYFTVLAPSPEQAASAYRAAVALDPHQPRYWLELASAYELLDDTTAQAAALEHALTTGPKIPEVAWQAGNFYAVRGETGKALAQLRFVLEASPSMAPVVLPLSLRISPAVDSVLQQVMPPDPRVYYALLELLSSRHDASGAGQTWAQLAGLRQPLDRSRVFDYVRFLLTERDVEQARRVWQQASALCGLSAYQPTDRNLLVNGDFHLDVLNGGFDWTYSKSPQVKLALDPTQSHAGHRSLLIHFDARSLDDAGIHQLVPVEPNTAYEFSAFFKTGDIQGAGGPQFTIQDLYNGTTYFSSDDLKDAENWTPVDGKFITGPDTRIVVLRIRREPAGSPIKGKLWIDDLRLSPAQS